MVKYQVWVGGSNPWSRSYTAEYGGARLTEEQIARWLPDYGKVPAEDLEVDKEAWMARLSSFDYAEDQGDLPSWSELTDCCMGCGAFTDQTFGVATEDDEILWTWDYGDIERDEDVADDDEYSGPVHMFIDDEDHLEGVWVLYNSYSKGGWGASVELPDGEEFDPSKLMFEIKNVEGFSEICTGFSYDGEDYYDESDSDGKGIDYYLVVDGHFKQLF